MEGKVKTKRVLQNVVGIILVLSTICLFNGSNKIRAEVMKKNLS